MEKVISVSIGEIILKGQNRRYFEDQLISRMRKAIGEVEYKRIYKEQGKIYIEAPEENLDPIIDRVGKVFGLVYISLCYRVEKDMEQIGQAALDMVKEKLARERPRTFKVETSRGDKSFPIQSPEVSRKIGALIFNHFEELGVDVHKPDFFVYIDIKREAYIYIDRIEGHRGMPVGTNGHGLLLLSGGIDSPVAGFMMAKRGMTISGVHYHSYPFTSERAEEKVKDLAKKLSLFTGSIRIYSVNILEIQKELNKKCPEREMTILSRRFMMRIAEEIAKANGLDALITGESLGQVASQTIEGVAVVNAAVKMPIFRPLIGLDKVDIIDISRDIDTYETSILPYDDCCTIFAPKNPVIKPRLADIEYSEADIDVDLLVGNAISQMKVYNIE